MVNSVVFFPTSVTASYTRIPTVSQHFRFYLKFESQVYWRNSGYKGKIVVAYPELTRNSQDLKARVRNKLLK